MPKINITDAEWRVMLIIWKRREATAAEVIEELAPEAGWNHRTIRTLLGRLVDKQALIARQDGHRYAYKAAVSKRRCIREASESFLEKIFAGQPGDLLLHFVQDVRLTPEDAARLKKLLDERIQDRD